VEVLARLAGEIEERELGGEVFVTNTGCFGVCDKGPIVVVYPDNVWYSAVTPDDVTEIIEGHIEGGKVVERLVL
jgi:(2Fe-2S) ferredoxin